MSEGMMIFMPADAQYSLGIPWRITGVEAAEDGVTAMIEGVYIDYDRIILDSHHTFVHTKREPLIAALERAALVTEEKVAGSTRTHVKLDIRGNTLKISANSSTGSTYDEIEIEHEGDDLLIAFNNRYLIDSLRSCTADRVKLSMTSALSSINIEPSEQGEDKELFLLLPVRMKE